MSEPTIEDMAIDYALRSGWSESGKELDTAESHCIKRAYQSGASEIVFTAKRWLDKIRRSLGNGETYDGLNDAELAIKHLNKLMGIEEKEEK